MKSIKFERLLLVTAIATALTACSSGGGGSRSSSDDSSPPPPPPPAAPTSPPYTSFAQQPADPADLANQAAEFEDGEYNGLGYLGMINASTAYARGATGEGVTVGVIDSGADTGHAEFDNGSGGSKIEILKSDYDLFGAERTDDAIDHGTIVSGIIAANRDGAPVIEGTSFNMHGVAFEADIAIYEVPLGSGDGIYDPVDLDDFSSGNDDLYFANLFDTVSDEVDIVNMSFGYPGVITTYSTSEVAAAFPQMIDELRQTSTSAADRTIYVVAAGNARGLPGSDPFGPLADSSSPELLAGLPYLFPELDDHMLAVVAVGTDGELTSYSNSCGVAAAFCLAAPGGGSSTGSASENVMWAPGASDPEGGEAGDYYWGVAGTSMAAPMVSGSLALLKQMFPTVGNDELVDRILDTANKTGIYADTSIYGQGLLDLAAATAPVGSTAIATSSSLSGSMVATSSTNLSITGSALGNSLSIGLAGQNLAIFDEMGFPFQMPAASLIIQTPTTPATSTLHHSTLNYGSELRVQSGRAVDLNTFDTRFHPELRDKQQRDYFTMHFQDTVTGRESFSGFGANAGWFFGLYGNQALQPGSTKDDSAFAAPWLRYARNGWSSGGGLQAGTGKLRFGIFRGEAGWDQHQPVSDSRAQGAIVEFAQPFSLGGLSIQTGVLKEDDSFLGVNTTGALGTQSGTGTWFSGINAHVNLSGNWRGLLAWYGGMTNPEIQSGLLSVNDNLFSSSFAMGINGHSLWQEGDSLGIFISQPLRIEKGSANLQLPTGRTKDKQVLFQDTELNLEPTGREYRLEFNYGFNLGLVRAAASLNYIQNPGHNDQLDNSLNTSISFVVPIDI